MITCCLKAYVIEPNEKGIFITTPTKIDKKLLLLEPTTDSDGVIFINNKLELSSATPVL